MSKSDDEAEKKERGESPLSPVPIIIMLAGGFATLVMAGSAWNLLRSYGGV